MPCSTVHQLLMADLKQSGVLERRYYSASSLPRRERRAHQPTVCLYRRDRVMKKLLQLSSEFALRRMLASNLMRRATQITEQA